MFCSRVGMRISQWQKLRSCFRESVPLRAEQKRHRAGSHLFADQAPAEFQTPQRMLKFPVPHRRRAHHQRAVGDGISDAFIFFRAGQQVRGADRGHSVSKCLLVRIHHAQLGKAEITHSASRSANVERVAR